MGYTYHIGVARCTIYFGKFHS